MQRYATYINIFPPTLTQGFLHYSPFLIAVEVNLDFRTVVISNLSHWAFIEGK